MNIRFITCMAKPGSFLRLLRLVIYALGFTTFSVTAQSSDRNGEYLALAGDCISCHTAPGGKPYAGGLKMQTPFGYLLSPNITPDLETGIGSWSKDDFARALHDGINKKGQDLYPD